MNKNDSELIWEAYNAQEITPADEWFAGWMSLFNDREVDLVDAQHYQDAYHDVARGFSNGDSLRRLVNAAYDAGYEKCGWTVGST